MKTITRREAVKILKTFIGKDLRTIAGQFGITVFRDGKINKGWAGHTLEHCIGLGLNSRQAPNGETWELKIVPLKKLKGRYSPKETMAITMINPRSVAEQSFEDSHLFHKLKSLIICGREFESKNEEHSTLVRVGTFDLVDKKIKDQVKEDYELTRQTIINKGFDELSGRMGVLVQPRTKGPGHGSKSRAFYARIGFVKQILNL